MIILERKKNMIANVLIGLVILIIIEFTIAQPCVWVFGGVKGANACTGCE
jgi:hypothetical protein